jgi:hypothetical protein
MSNYVRPVYLLTMHEDFGRKSTFFTRIYMFNSESQESGFSSVKTRAEFSKIFQIRIRKPGVLTHYLYFPHRPINETVAWDVCHHCILSIMTNKNVEIFLFWPMIDVMVPYLRIDLRGSISHPMELGHLIWDLKEQKTIIFYLSSHKKVILYEKIKKISVFHEWNLSGSNQIFK